MIFIPFYTLIINYTKAYLENETFSIVSFFMGQIVGVYVSLLVLEITSYHRVVDHNTIENRFIRITSGAVIMYFITGVNLDQYFY